MSFKLFNNLPQIVSQQTIKFDDGISFPLCTFKRSRQYKNITPLFHF